MAWGRFVAPSVTTPSRGPPLAPSRQLRNVESTRASAPRPSPPARSQTSASISSKKRMQGVAASAAAKARRTVASASPR